MCRTAKSCLRPSAGLIALFCLPGCIGVLHTPFEPDAGTSDYVLVKHSEPAFPYRSASAPPRASSLLNVQPDYDKFLLDFPPVEGSGDPAVSVSAYYYRSKETNAQSAVIILPIWGSYRYPPNRMAATLRRRSEGSTHVIQLLGDEPLIDWQALSDAGTEAEFEQVAGNMAGRVADMVTGVRQIIDWAEKQPEIAETRIGIVGFSMGAIVAAIVLGVDERLSAGAMMMGAGKPGEVFATCSGKPARVRKTAMRRFGWSRERYQELFERLFAPGDPANFSDRYRPEELLIIDGAFDDCMPRDAREALWEATGRPERMRFLARHKWAFLAMTPFALNLADKKIHDFMEKILISPRDPQTVTGLRD